MTIRQRVNKQIQKEFQKKLTDQYQDILFFYKKNLVNEHAYYTRML